MFFEGNIQAQIDCKKAKELKLYIDIIGFLPSLISGSVHIPPLPNFFHLLDLIILLPLLAVLPARGISRKHLRLICSKNCFQVQLLNHALLRHHHRDDRVHHHRKHHQHHHQQNLVKPRANDTTWSSVCKMLKLGHVSANVETSSNIANAET